MVAMSPTDAYSTISSAMARMSALYGRTLFDEWAVVRLGPRSANAEHYEGPRLPEFLASCHRDIEPLRREAASRSHEPGDFDFARTSSGTSIDALVKIAADAYLLCNNTGLSMEEIRGKPEWLKAQVPFANLAERFRTDPVVYG